MSASAAEIEGQAVAAHPNKMDLVPQLATKPPKYIVLHDKGVFLS